MNAMRGTHLVMVGLVALSLLIGCASEDDLLDAGGAVRKRPSPDATATAPTTEQSLAPSGSTPSGDPNDDPTAEPTVVPTVEPSEEPLPDPIEFPSGDPLPTSPPSTDSEDVDPVIP
jgi:hypothetical protein